MARFLPSPVERARPRQGSRRLAVTCAVTARRSAEALSGRSGGADLRRGARLRGEAQEGLAWHADSPGRPLGNTCRTVRRFSHRSRISLTPGEDGLLAEGPHRVIAGAGRSCGREPVWLSKCHFTQANIICFTEQIASTPAAAESSNCYFTVATAVCETAGRLATGFPARMR